MLKKIFFKIYTFFFYLFKGLHNADRVAFGTGNNGDSSNGGDIEAQDETDSVYKDLLKGEVTQEVKELRHEMYYSERGANNFSYVGNGIAKKKKSMFSEYGNIDEIDGHKVQLIQENKEIDNSLSYSLLNDVDSKNERNFTIVINRDFSPRIRIEEFVNKIVVRPIDENNVILDLYATKYENQFNRRQRLFLNEIRKINDGFIKSDLIDFKTLEFLSFKAYGASDGLIFKYFAPKFKEIVEWEGDYIIRFEANILLNGDDTISQYFDEIAQRKSDEHESREGDTLTATIVKNDDNYNYDMAEDVINEFLN